MTSMGIQGAINCSACKKCSSLINGLLAAEGSEITLMVTQPKSPTLPPTPPEAVNNEQYFTEGAVDGQE